jgi:hypothetical protein
MSVVGRGFEKSIKVLTLMLLFFLPKLNKAKSPYKIRA